MSYAPRPLFPKFLTLDEAKAQGPLVEVAAAKLHMLSGFYAARWWGPVWLVGSAHTTPTPRDIDIRVIMADDEFAMLYHQLPTDFRQEGPSQRWIDDMAHFHRQAFLWSRLAIDIQVWPALMWEEKTDRPRRLLASPSPKWNLSVPAPA